MKTSAAPAISFRSAEEQDFPILEGWLAEPHVRQFYQPTPVTLEEIAREYGPCIRGEEPSLCHLAINAGSPFAYLQCYRNADYPEWGDMIGVEDGISVDLYIGESTYLRKGFGRAALSLYLQRIAFPHYCQETHAYIAHDQRNLAALSCSRLSDSVPCERSWKNGLQDVIANKGSEFAITAPAKCRHRPRCSLILVCIL